MNRRSVIWKYEFEVKDRFSIEMPEASRILCVQTQNDNACLWVHTDPDAKLEGRNFVIHGTGHLIDSEEVFYYNYIGTFQLLQGNFVGHLFEVIQP